MDQPNVSTDACLFLCCQNPFGWHLAEDDKSINPACLRSKVCSSTVADNPSLPQVFYFPDPNCSPVPTFWTGDTNISGPGQDTEEFRSKKAGLADIIIHSEETAERLLSSYEPGHQPFGCLSDGTTCAWAVDLVLTNNDSCNISDPADHVNLETGPLTSFTTIQAELDKGSDSCEASDTTTPQTNIQGFLLGSMEEEAGCKWLDVTNFLEISLFYEVTSEGLPVQIVDAHDLYPKSSKAITDDDTLDSYTAGNNLGDDLDPVDCASDSSSLFLANEVHLDSRTLTSPERHSPELCGPQRGTGKKTEYIDLTDDNMPFSQPLGPLSIPSPPSAGSISKETDVIDLTQED